MQCSYLSSGHVRAVLHEGSTGSSIYWVSVPGHCSHKKWGKLGKSGHISYKRVRELTLQRLAKLGYDIQKFSVHSFRAGGATTAANAGIPHRLFKRHGHWRSESAKDGYVKNSVESRLSVSRSLDL